MIGNQEMRSEENQPFDELTVKPHRDAPVHPGYIARSVASVIRRTRESLSPWVQRWWQADPPAADPGLRREPSVARQHRIAFSETETRSLLGRLQRTVDRSVVWRADVGSIEPGMVDRFTHAIVDRFRPIAPKYEPRTLELDPDQASELVLTTGPLPAIVGAVSPSEPSSEPLMGRVAPSSFSPASPSAAHVQRAVVPSPPVRRPAPLSPPVSPSPRPSTRGQRVRFFSRVEEIPAETSAAMPDSPSGLLSSALGSPPVQRQLDEEMSPPPLSRREEALAAGLSRMDEPVSPVTMEGPPSLPSGGRIAPDRAETPPVQRQVGEGIPSPALTHREGSSAVEFPGVEEPVSPVTQGSSGLSLSRRDVPDRAETPPVESPLDEAIPPPALSPQKDVRAAGLPRAEEPISPVTEEGPPSLPSSGRGVPDRAESPPVQRQVDEGISPPALSPQKDVRAAGLSRAEEPVSPVTEDGPPSFPSSGRGVPDQAETPSVESRLDEEIPPPVLSHREGAPAAESLGVDEPISPMTALILPSSQKTALERAETLLERGLPATPLPPVQRQLEEAPHPALPHREDLLAAGPSGTPEGPVDLLPDRESLPDHPETPAGPEESPPWVQRQLDVEIPPPVPSRREDLPVAELPRTEGNIPLETMPGPPGLFSDQEIAPEKMPMPLPPARPPASSPSLQRHVGLEMPYRALPGQEDVPSVEPSWMDEPTAALKNEIVARAASRSQRPLTGSLTSSQVSISHRGTRALLAAQRWRFKPLLRASSPDPGRIARAVDDLGQDPGRGRSLERESRGAMEEIVSRDFGEVRTAHLSLPDVKATTRERKVYVESGQSSFESPRSLASLGHEWAHVARSGFAGTRPVVQTAILPQARAPARFGDKEAKAEEDERRGFLPLLSTPRVTGMPLWQPVVERRELDSVGLSHALEAEFPLPPVSHPVSAETIQRQPAGDAPDLAAVPGNMGVVQRAAETLPETGETSEKASSGLDLDDLARQIYPLVKRMLAVERERRSGRWS